MKRLLITTYSKVKSVISRILPSDEYAVEEVQIGEIAAIDCEVPRCDWIVVTSKNAIDALEKARRFGGRIAAVGEETAKEIASRGFEVAFTPKGGNAASLSEELRGVLRPEDRVVRLMAKGIEDKCGALAAFCDYRIVEAYENREVEITRKIDLSRYDILVITASSAVERLFNVAVNLPRRIIAMGPSTASELKKRGIDCEESSKPSMKVIAEMIMRS